MNALRAGLLRFVLFVTVVLGVYAGLRTQAAHISDVQARVLTAANAREILAETFTAYDDPAEEGWTLDRMVAQVAATMSRPHPERSLYRALAAQVSAADLPDPEAAPLAKLREERLPRALDRGETEVTVVSEAALSTLLTGLRERGVVVRSARELRGELEGALGLWLATWLLVGGALLVADLRAGERRASLAPWVVVVGIAAIAGVGLGTQASAEGLGGVLDLRRQALITAAGALVGVVAGFGLRTRGHAHDRLPAAVTGGSALVFVSSLVLAVMSVLASGPASSRAFVNLVLPGLGTIQPLEVLKFALVGGLAQYLGRRASMFRVGSGPAWRSLPDPRLFLHLLLGATVLGFTGFSVSLGDRTLGLGDMGTVLVAGPALALIILAATGARGILSALVVLGTLLGWLLVARADILPVDLPVKFAERVRMQQDPWFNLLAGCDQLAVGWWALASGGPWGRGIAAATAAFTPAARTDLVLVHLGELNGAWIVIAVILGYAVIVAALGRIAANLPPQWRPESRFGVFAVAGLLAAQCLVATGGVFGLIPLSGIVSPWLSAGGTAAMCFTATCVAVAFLAYSPGEARPVDPGHRGAGAALVVALAAFVVVSVRVWTLGVADAEELAARPVVTGTEALGSSEVSEPVVRRNPRLTALLGRIPPPTVLDRKGQVVARSLQGRREYPYGASLGTPLGVRSPELTPNLGTIERLILDQVSPFPQREVGAFIERCAEEPCASEQRVVVGFVAGTVPPSPAPGEHLRPLYVQDVRELVPLLRASPDAVEEALGAIRARLPDWSTTLDAELQSEIYALVEAKRAERGWPAVVVVVDDARTGERLVQLSAPGLDPTGVTRAELQRESRGVWGRMIDHTTHGLPPGSVMKPIVSVASMEAGISDQATYACTESPAASDRERHWGARCRLHGNVDRRLGHLWSCNAYFAQLSTAIGRQRLLEVVLRLPIQSFAERGTWRELGDAGFGQGEVVISAGDLVPWYSAFAQSGVARRCELAGPVGEPARCLEVAAVNAEAAARELALLREVVVGKGGTGWRGKEPVDVSWRVHGKTGTAEHDAVRGEAAELRAFPKGGGGVSAGADHAWFSGVYVASGRARLSFTILVPRAGEFGGVLAAPLAPAIGQLLDRHGYL